MEVCNVGDRLGSTSCYYAIIIAYIYTPLFNYNHSVTGARKRNENESEFNNCVQCRFM